MTSFCTLHNIEMDEKESKSKFNPDGTPKTYYAHKDASGALCFGESTSKATTAGRSPFVKPAPARKTDEAMSKADWNQKEFVKGLGVFSAAARGEGMDPVTAFREMHIAEWLRTAYGDMDGYEEWIAGLKARLAKLNQDVDSINVELVSRKIDKEK